MLDPKLLPIVMMTIKVSGTALLLACLIGVPFGIITGIGSFRGKRFLQILISTGMGLPPVVVGLVVFILFSNDGPLGVLDWLFSAKGMITAQTILAFPLAAGLTSSAVGAVSPKLILQIRSMGATTWQERWAIFFQARRGVLSAVLAAFGRIVSEVGAVMLVGGNIDGPTRVLSTAIVLETRQGEFGFAFALGMILLGIALIANALTLYFGGGWEK